MKLALAAVLLVLVLNTDAEARRRGVALIGFGEKLSHVTDLPDEEFGDADLGLYYNSFRLFFVPVITWDKQYVIYKDDGYAELDDDELTVIKESVGSLAFKGNLWVKCVNYFWPFLVVAFIVFRAVRKRQLARIDEEFQHLQ